MAESRARERIRKAVESRGHEVLSLDWEPVYDAGEMQGYGGGWTLAVSPGIYPNSYPDNDIYGMSVEEVLAYIDYWIKPSDPCECDRSHSAMTAAGLINDPCKPTHRPECKWHIPYRLRWWDKREPRDAGAS